MKYKKFQHYQRRAYSTVYSEKEGGFHDNAIKELAEKFLPDLGIASSARILDIGCGPGVFMEVARGMGYHNLLGVTLSRDDHDICRSKGFETINSSMSDLDLKDATVDFIWCRHALEHSPYPLFTLYEFHRVLKDHALMFIEVPGQDNERAFMHEYNPNHYSIMGERMWLGLFDKSGFDCVGNFVYNVNVEFQSRLVTEKSLIFVVRKSTEDLREKFLEKYGIDIQDQR